MSEDSLIVLTIAVGLSLAGSIFIVMEYRRRLDRIVSPADIASTILCEVAVRGGVVLAVAKPIAERDGGGVVSASPIDLESWAARFAELSGREERGQLLRKAVVNALASSSRLSISQYELLQQLSFALGFRTDALASLKRELGFEFDDHSADRA